MTLTELAATGLIAAAVVLCGSYLVITSQDRLINRIYVEGSSNNGKAREAIENLPSSNMDPFTKLPDPIADPRVIVRKQARVLELYDGKKLIKTYKAALGFAPVGDKEIEGDGRTPEGDFYVFVKNEKSKFTASLGLSYPNKEDAGRGIAAGLITQDEADEINRAIDSHVEPPQKTKLGGDIYIHGHGANTDWTWGCIALSDSDILELFALARTGMPVTILP
jgi:hypothetical protein